MALVPKMEVEVGLSWEHPNKEAIMNWWKWLALSMLFYLCVGLTYILVRDCYLWYHPHHGNAANYKATRGP